MMRVARALLWLSTLGAAWWLGASWQRLTVDSQALADDLRTALLEPEAAPRVDALARRLDAVTARNADSLGEILRAETVGDAERRMLAQAWGRTDGPGALRRVHAEWPADTRHPVLGEIIYAWALRNPMAALDGLKAEGELQGEPLVQLVSAWGRTPDFRSATEFAAQVQGEDLRQRLLASVAQARFAVDGAEGVIAWAESIREDSPGYLKLTGHREAVRVLTNSDPQRAAAWAETNYERPHAKGTLRIVASTWARSDPAEALAWLSARRPGAERDQAVTYTFRTWIKRDPEAAGAWLLGAMPNNANNALEPAINLYARWIARKSPAEALQWAARIENEELRIHCLTGVGRVWMLRDAEAARAWLDEADLPDDTKAEIVKVLERGRGKPKRG